MLFQKTSVMKPTVFTIMIMVPFFCCSQYTYKNLQVNFLETNAELKNYSYQNLRLYPIYAKQSFKSQFKNVGKYMPLQEALQKKKLKITEKTNGGDVNNLTIENVSNDTIIIICGDVIKGGQQDRIVQKDIVLKPKSGKKNLEVFCVESGRWSAREAAVVPAQNRVSTAAIETPPPAQFEGHYNKGSMGLRKVVEKDKDQSKVWSKVEEINTSNKTTTSTKTYTAITSSADFTKKLNGYIQFFKNKFVADTNVIGVVIVTGNKVLGCDMFATPALFSSQFQSLLHSYATEAIISGEPVTVTVTVVKAYMDKLLGNESMQQSTLKEKGNAFVEKGKKLRVSSFD
jgi:hypothetical protein